MLHNATTKSAAFAVCVIAACCSANAGDNVVQVADKAGNFKTLIAAAKAAGLAHTLQEDGPFTIFAPTDEAFSKLPEGLVGELLKPENKPKLTKLLKYHVVSGKVAARDAVRLESAKTLAGDSVSISIQGGQLTLNNAKVTVNDLQASNGIIHVIDSVLVPPLPEPVDLVETAKASGKFKTLLAALEAAELTDTFRHEGPFTIFAPTDEAFGKLPQGVVESLLKPENKEELQAVLQYHVATGRRTADDVIKWSGIRTIGGKLINISSDHPLKLNDSNVVATDIRASNGLIHVIDLVLTPPAAETEVFKSGFDVLQRLNPELEHVVGSAPGEQTTVTFCNLSNEPVQVYWINYKGERQQWRKALQPRALAVCSKSFTEHVWLIADEHGKGLGLYLLNEQDGLIVHR